MIQYSQMGKKGHRKYSINDSFFDRCGSLQYWLLGLLAADGSIVAPRYVTLSQSGEHGLELIRYINRILRNTAPVRSRKTKRQDAHSLYFCSEAITVALRKYNIIPKKTQSYTFPESVTEEFIREFIRGYFEGDGSLGAYVRKKSNTKCLTVSMVGTRKFINVAKSKIPVKRGHVRIHSSGSVYEIRWNGRAAIEMCKWMYASPELYETYKTKIFNEYMSNPPAFLNKDKQRNIIQSVILSNPDINMMEISRTEGVLFQTLYRWRTAIV